MKAKAFFRFVLLCFLPMISLGQTDTEFWFAAPAVTTQTVLPSPVLVSQLNSPIIIYFTTDEAPAYVTVEQPANPLFTPITCVVDTDSAEVVNLTPYLELVENKPADSILNYGLKITSDKRITACYEIQSPHNAATYTLSGKNALGYSFIIPAQNHFSNYPYCNPPARNSFELVATEDSTIVVITPSNEIEGHPAHVPFSILVHQGQSWSGRAVSGDSMAHLGGTFVNSTKPIAITVTDDAIYVPGTNAHAFDVAGDQLIPESLAGNEFIAIAMSIPAAKTKILAYAYEDDTEIVFNDSLSIQTQVINTGEYAEFSFTELLNIPHLFTAYIHSDKPVSVFEFTGCDHEIGTPSYHSFQASACIVPPITCSGSKKLTLSSTPPGVPWHNWMVYLITKKENKDSFTFDPPTWTTNVSLPIPGTGGEWVWGMHGIGNANYYYRVLISNSQGRFIVPAYSYAIFANASFGKYSYFSDFSSLNLGVDRQFCPGDSVFLDAGFGRDSYLWSTGDTTSTLWVKTPGIYWVNTSEPDCYLTDTVDISYYSFTQVNLGPDRIICNGDSILLDAGPGRAWYQWNTGDTTQNLWIKNAGTYWVRVPDIHCIVADTLQLLTTPTPGLTNNPLAKTICSGDSTNIPLTSTTPGTIFTWTASLTSGNVIGFSADSGVVINQILMCTSQETGVVTYHITPQVGDCIGEMVDFPVTITPGDTVSVSISVIDDTVCQGLIATFSAIPIQGGFTPQYQWMINGINFGPNDPLFEYYPVDRDTVSCIITSSYAGCITNNPATSNEIIMTVYPNIPVSISISVMENPVCEGEAATFTATSANKGSLPVFQWFVNSIPAGTNDSTYNYIPFSGDQIFCVLTSSEQCTTNNPASSDTITVIVNPLLPVGISISASTNPVCEGLPVTFTAIPVNGGTMPAYQWQVNGINTGTNNPDFIYTPVNGDFVTCILTSNAECVTNNPASSTSITMSVGEAPDVSFAVCFDTVTTLNAKPFKLKGGIPLGGTYSGPGVDQITGYFNPAMAGVGVKTISYSYTNLFNCSNNATRAITVINPAPFACGDSLTDIRDNKKYPTIQIGSQCWMAANLNYGVQIPGSQNQRDNCIPEKYCFNDIPELCALSSALYQWDELMGYEDTEEIQGLCPPGWHVPSEADWNQLFAVYQGNAFAGKPLLYTGYSGFNVLLAGVEFFNQSHRFADFASIMWSSTSHGLYKAWSHGLNEYNYSVSYYPSYRSNAFSVRCVRD